MFLWITKQISISILFIILIHYLYNYFKTNLTIPKVKDLVNEPKNEYNTIFKDLQKISRKENEERQQKNKEDSMKAELEAYLDDINENENEKQIQKPSFYDLDNSFGGSKFEPI